MNNMGIFSFIFFFQCLIFTLTIQDCSYNEASPSGGSGGGDGGGSWALLLENVGFAAMHMQLLHDNKVMMFDRADFGPSNLTIPGNYCRRADKDQPLDCTAHSLIYDVHTTTRRPLFLQTDVWCSSGAVLADGTLIQTGGYREGCQKIRLFQPCEEIEQCQWIEKPENLFVRRWYATDQILPDGRIIIIGGRDTFSYEYFPKDPANPDNMIEHPFPFLNLTKEYEENNLYPFIHLMPDGNLFIFANRRSILFDHVTNRVILEYPEIPGEARNYPSTGSSALLPLYLSHGGESPAAEVMVCGGAMAGNYNLTKKRIFREAARSCGRLGVTDPNPEWVMEDMPIPRTMGYMIMLPTGDVLIINGAKNGTAAWESAVEPVLNPVLYKTNEPDGSKRFVVMKRSTIPRMYHSTAVLLPDGKVLVGGSNPHQFNNFKAKFSTELRLEAFSPHYLDPQLDHLRPRIVANRKNKTAHVYSYGQKIPVRVLWVSDQESFDVGEIKVVLLYPSFSTHSVAMNQRLLVLPILETMELTKKLLRVVALAPKTPNVAPAGYYMLFVVNRGVPSQAVWVKIE